MKKQLILVKHSIPEIMEGIPAREWRLSEEGQSRAHRLAERLQPFQIEAIFSSVEPKAQDTAEIVARKNRLELCVVEGLHEHDRSNVSYLSKDEFHAAVHEFFERPDTLVFGNETANQSHARFNQAVLSILNLHSGKTIAVVAHGTVISLFISRLTGISDILLWNELGLPSFVVIDTKSGSLIERENII